MSKVSYGSRWGRVQTRVKKDASQPMRPVEDVVREMKESSRKAPGADYRERSLRIHGLVCARCGREFNGTNRHLLTVHHRDGNHHNNPADGSNWENLCVYCHEDEHSRGLLGEYYAETDHRHETSLVYRDDAQSGDSDPPEGTLAGQLKRVLERRGKK